jgi:transcriptional regulator with XRE-family HTH domain
MSISPTPDAHDGEYLYNLWRSSGLSQRQLAKQLGMSFNALHGLIWRYQVEQGLGNRETDGNVMTASAVVPRVRSLEDLIEALGVNTDEWEILEYRVHKYDAYRKDTQKDISFENGKISGTYRDNGDLTIEELYSVQAKFARKNPEPLQPVVSPVRVNLGPLPTFERSEADSVLFVSDLHIGFRRNLRDGRLDPTHDRLAISAVLNLIATLDFDQIIIGGDLLDMAEWSDKYAREPEFYWTTQASLIEMGWLLGQIRSLTDAKVVVLGGNHEERLSGYLLKHAVHAYGIEVSGKPWHSLDAMLGLSDLGILEVQPPYWIGETRFEHGETVKSRSGATASNVVENSMVSTVFGHIHRIELAWKTLWGREPKQIFAASSGCLCRVDGAVPAVKAENNWQQGVLILRHNATIPVPVPIVNGAAYVDGWAYHGSDYVETLRSDTQYNF